MLAGRDDVIEDFADGLSNGPGDPYRALLVTGARGSGKTVLLNRLEDEARQQNWAVLSLTTRPGMLEDIVGSRLPRLIQDHAPQARTGVVTGLGISGPAGIGVDVSREMDKPLEIKSDFRELLFQLADEMDHRNGAGVLISIDEIHRKASDDLQVITQEVQHAFREGRQVALAGAGLPNSVSDLLNGEVMTFMRRAQRSHMGSVDPTDVADALREPIERNGKTINPDALDHATNATGGYPYLIQSVGYETWRAARHDETITLEHAEAGTDRARRKIGSMVHEPELRTLSDGDKSYLSAMALDNGPSRTGEVAERLGVSAQHAGVYRARLIDADVITPTTRGRVDFTLPYLRDYLREHVATEALQISTPTRSTTATHRSSDNAIMPLGDAPTSTRQATPTHGRRARTMPTQHNREHGR